MVRRPAHKEDFLTAIQYELHLDRLRKQRKKVRIKPTYEIGSLSRTYIRTLCGTSLSESYTLISFASTVGLFIVGNLSSIPINLTVVVVVIVIVIVVVCQRLGVTKSRRDADYGIQNRIHGLFRVRLSPCHTHKCI